jgi:hypothetical protein
MLSPDVAHRYGLTPIEDEIAQPTSAPDSRRSVISPVKSPPHHLGAYLAAGRA